MRKPVSVKFVLFGLLISYLFSMSAQASTGLLSLYELALEKDAKLTQAKAQLAADEELLNQAKAILLPSVSAQLTLQQTDYSKQVILATKSLEQEKLQLNQSLYDASAWARYEQAKSSVDAAQLVYQQAEQDLRLRVAQAYFDVLRADQLSILTQAQLTSTQQQKDKITEGVNIGLTNPVDLLEVQARYDLVVADQLQADNQQMVARENLSKIIGQVAPTKIKQLSFTATLPSLGVDPVQLANTTQANSLAVQVAAKQLSVAEQEVEAQRAGHLPTVSLQANVMNQDATANSFPGYPSAYPYQSNNVALTVNMPIYAGGMVDSQVRKAHNKKLVAQAALRDNEEQSRLTILTLAKTVNANQTRLFALRQAVKSNQAFLAAAEEGQRVGLRELVDVLNARTALLKAKQDLANGLYDDVLTRLKLKLAQGSLQQADLAQLEAYLVDGDVIQ